MTVETTNPAREWRGTDDLYTILVSDAPPVFGHVSFTRAGGCWHWWIATWGSNLCENEPQGSAFSKHDAFEACNSAIRKLRKSPLLSRK